MKRLSYIILICFIITLTACGRTIDTVNKTPGENVTGEISTATVTNTPETSTDTQEISTESPAPEESQTQSQATENTHSNNTADTTSKPTNPPVEKTPSQSQSPPTTSIPTQPPASTPPPSSTSPTTSTPTTPAYEILGQDYLNGVLNGINERRKALGLPLAKLDSALTNECLVQAKKMAEDGREFHSEHPTGCEGVAKVPYNFPADLMGDMMCNHVADFTYEATIKIGVAVVKSGNSLFVVVQGTA